MRIPHRRRRQAVAHTCLVTLPSIALIASALSISATACDDPAAPPLFDGGGGGAGGSEGGAGGSSSSEGGGGGDIFATSSSTTGGAGGVGGSGGMAEGGADTTGCGDGIIQPGEVCDDGNSMAADGCSADCSSIENNFACPTPGEACVSTVVCGDALITGAETCDDGNTLDGDGCSNVCTLEAGWQCNGYHCTAAACGDGIVAGTEECEDGVNPPVAGDGCDASCKREAGWECSTPNMPCHQTVCGDGMKEGDEPCDDGNDIVGDGCGPDCTVEPNCSNGACTSSCGDGLLLPADNEQCDDGNTTDGDGCSSQCVIEAGFECTLVMSALPAAVEVPVVYRDFVAYPDGNGPPRHPDFETYSGSSITPGLVQSTLDADGKPVSTGICDANQSGPCPHGQQSSTVANFAQWFRDTANVNSRVVSTLSLQKQPNNTYYFPDATFFPLDGIGWMGQGENASGGHNFGFTSEIRTWFQFEGGESLAFSGDDDVWVFIAGQLALDVGGLHPPQSADFTLDAATASALGLVQGNVYEMALFHAERHTSGSNFNLTLGGFAKTSSSCAPTCGDGIVAGDELCDDGVNDGSYGSCNPDCTPGPSCGDATLQSPPEICDDGVNLATYSLGNAPGCAPGCVPGGYCGDGAIDSLFGEQCDDAVNDGSYGGCNDNCTLGDHCGDGLIQQGNGEECDDGNTVSGDGCSKNCKTEGPN